MAVNRICEKCSELNKTCTGMAAFYSGCIYFKKKEESNNEEHSRKQIKAKTVLH